ncbi:hypothetical protein BGZ63DRAFT_395335 [Mariannaea sp. PMI_226]|nr:hypothetical protein BGZ63DRAFT_395335 [Mariannaea sp. PMI_226]
MFICNVTVNLVFGLLNHHLSASFPICCKHHGGARNGPIEFTPIFRERAPSLSYSISPLYAPYGLHHPADGVPPPPGPDSILASQ